MDRLPEIAAWLMVAILVAVAVMGIAALIYSTPVLDEGVVIDKTYEPANTTYIYQKVGDVSYYQPIWDDEDWILRVQGTTDEGKARTENWEVSREQWERAEIGDRVTRTEG